MQQEVFLKSQRDIHGTIWIISIQPREKQHCSWSICSLMKRPIRIWEVYGNINSILARDTGNDGHAIRITSC